MVQKGNHVLISSLWTIKYYYNFKSNNDLKINYIFFIEYNIFKMIYILYIIKFILELIVYIIGSVKLKNSFNIINFIIWHILEIPYVVIVGIGSFFNKNIKWRGQISPE